MIYGNIVSLKRFEIHDGPGCRTTLFLKGCPLKCRWCHNPECIHTDAELGYYDERCIGCGLCAEVCDNGAHIIGESHSFDRKKCKTCGQCAEVCLGDALKLYGKKVTPSEILPILLEDRDFYGLDGGVTISGGEPMMQPDFLEELLRLLKREKINTAVDTCGFCSREALERILPYTDMFLYDIKAYSEKTHLAATGASNRCILDNLSYLDSLGCSIEIRVPYIPTMNNNEMTDIGRFLTKLKHITKVKILPYHNYAKQKYSALGRTAGYIPLPSSDEIAAVLDLFRTYGLNVVGG